MNILELVIIFLAGITTGNFFPVFKDHTHVFRNKDVNIHIEKVKCISCHKIFDIRKAVGEWVDWGFFKREINKNVGRYKS